MPLSFLHLTLFINNISYTAGGALKEGSEEAKGGGAVDASVGDFTITLDVDTLFNSKKREKANIQIRLSKLMADSR